MIDLSQITLEHAKIFPIADLRGQRLKLLEEVGEFARAGSKEKMEKEASDCLIVCAGIKRFDDKLAEQYKKNIYRAVEVNRLDVNKVEEYVFEKWKINMSRTWKYENGKYHHVGIDGAE